ncbi:hypothetical protein CAPTEDRAFT_198549 [Capitella teleta]|uniref:Uncharacterized protein n=1 Tax=Capitella teleta TaxID=283909 RepID=R7U4U8_CAPTE|nr:hypothetical protein CAPTEDRAFT_198549 [Capitella teleta]|eukprot:ELT98721.1 hypothetical protein CAPTEDRAFT_198549 [Capitella teleta]
MADFTLVDENYVSVLLAASPVKTCDLDPMPTELIKELLYHCTTLKKRRGAYEKGQDQMILDDIIPESEVPDREKAWIDPKSAAAVKVEEVVFNNHRLKDLATLSPHFQTYDLEAFHSLLNQFALN